MYLYFNENLKKIIALTDEVEKEGLTPLTPEQLERWRSNPKAHWTAIMNEPTHYEQPTPAEPTLEELKADALKKLSDLSLEILGSHVGEYQMMNALLSLRADEYDKIYDDDKSQDLIDVYLTVGKMCREKYYEAKSAIEACETKEQVKGVKDEYNERYEQLRKAQ